jgi:hypothetical protein
LSNWIEGDMHGIRRTIAAVFLLTLAAASATAQTVSGALTWNANGSLAQLVGVDSFNSANAQTCTYKHDDLGRLSQVDCGTGQLGQDYNYDPFGNISWSALPQHEGGSFPATYDTSKNWLSSVGSYDANGNRTSDGVHQYAWDADGHLSRVDSGAAIVYDALGRRVEQPNGCVSPQPDPASLAVLLRPTWGGLSFGLRERKARANGWSDAARSEQHGMRALVSLRTYCGVAGLAAAMKKSVQNAQAAVFQTYR